MKLQTARIVLASLLWSTACYAQSHVVDLTQEQEEKETLGVPGYHWGFTSDGSTEPVIPWSIRVDVVNVSRDAKGSVLSLLLKNVGSEDAFIPISLEESKTFRDGMKKRYSLSMTLVPALPKEGATQQPIKSLFGSTSTADSLYTLQPGQSVDVKLRSWPLKTKPGESWRIELTLTRMFDDRLEEAARSASVLSQEFPIEY